MNLSTLSLSSSDAASLSSVLALKKLVPRSHLRSLTRPRSAKNLLSPQMKALASMASRTSMWMALLLRHVNTRPQRLAFGAPPLVLRVCTAQGPKTSKPTLVKGGQTSVLSCGRSAMRCFNGGPLSFLQGTQAPMTFVTVSWPPISQNPACWMAPPVICLR